MQSNPKYDLSSPPPESWLPARRFALRVVGPIERFMHIEAASGLVLVIAAAVALIWANSALGHTYGELWHTPIRLGFGEWAFEEDLHFWINDFLMAIFFFVVGLEIKREIIEGALSDIRRATLPIAPPSAVWSSRRVYTSPSMPVAPRVTRGVSRWPRILRLPWAS